MQADATAVVEAIGEIGGMIEELNTGSASIAAAVEEQHSSTHEIARNTQNAADGTQQVTSNIGEVSNAIAETEHAASEVKAASSQLASEAERLRQSVQEFLSTVRAAQAPKTPIKKTSVSKTAIIGVSTKVLPCPQNAPIH